MLFRSCWTIVGERWGNVGMAKATEKLGPKAGPIVASMKRIQPNLEARLKNLRKGDKKAAEIQKALDTLREAVQAYEAKY